MIGFYDYTVIATYLATVLGVGGIFLAADGLHLPAVFCLLLAGLLDTFDGRIARTKKDRSEQQKHFGIQIDSLSDLICFGVLPACIGYSVGMRHPAFWIVLAAYVLAALIRLAYFNVSEEDRQKETTECRRSYEGLPVTCCSFILPVVYLLHGRMQSVAFTWIWTAALLLIAGAFLWRFRIPKPDFKGMLGLMALGIAEFVLLALFAR